MQKIKHAELLGNPKIHGNQNLQEAMEEAARKAATCSPSLGDGRSLKELKQQNTQKVAHITRLRAKIEQRELVAPSVDE